MSRARTADGEEVTHSVRGAPRYGLIIKTRCGVEVRREPGTWVDGQYVGGLRTQYITTAGTRMTAVPAGSLKPITCNRCRKLLRMPLIGFPGERERMRELIKSKAEKDDQ